MKKIPYKGVSYKEVKKNKTLDGFQDDNEEDEPEE